MHVWLLCRFVVIQAHVCEQTIFMTCYFPTCYIFSTCTQIHTYTNPHTKYDPLTNKNIPCHHNLRFIFQILIHKQLMSTQKCNLNNIDIKKFQKYRRYVEIFPTGNCYETKSITGWYEPHLAHRLHLHPNVIIQGTGVGEKI